MALHVQLWHLTGNGTVLTMSNMIRLSRMAGTTILVALALGIAPLGYAQQSRERCDIVSIDAAGQFRIKHSKIKSALATHNRNGVPPIVELWPPSKSGSDNNDVLELIVIMDDTRLTADCRIVHQNRLPDVVTCLQSGVGVLEGLAVVAKLKISAGAQYEKKMADIFNYLINDVFDCGQLDRIFNQLNSVESERSRMDERRQESKLDQSAQSDLDSDLLT
jgi:hypothetical protein